MNDLLTRLKEMPWGMWTRQTLADRKSTRLNSSHLGISYAVFCLKKTKKESTPASGNTGSPQNSSPTVVLWILCRSGPAAKYVRMLCALVALIYLLFFFFLKSPGHTEIIPSSPPGPSPV